MPGPAVDAGRQTCAVEGFRQVACSQPVGVHAERQSLTDRESASLELRRQWLS